MLELWAHLKDSKSQKQIILSSHTQKTNGIFHIFLPWLLKSPKKLLKQKIKLQQLRTLIFLIRPLLEARAKKCEKFHWFFEV